MQANMHIPLPILLCAVLVSRDVRGSKLFAPTPVRAVVDGSMTPNAKSRRVDARRRVPAPQAPIQLDAVAKAGAVQRLGVETRFKAHLLIGVHASEGTTPKQNRLQQFLPCLELCRAQLTVDTGINIKRRGG